MITSQPPLVWTVWQQQTRKQLMMLLPLNRVWPLLQLQPHDDGNSPIIIITSNHQQQQQQSIHNAYIALGIE